MKQALALATTRRTRRTSSGFTLIEVLVALAAMAFMAALGWRGIDSLLRGREVSQQRIDQMAVMQTALMQWQSDLDAVFSLPNGQSPPGLEWDGRVLRILRRASVPDARGADAGLWVVSWTMRQPTADEAARLGLPSVNPPPCWVRTQFPASSERGVLQQYWAAAVQAAGDPIRGADTGAASVSGATASHAVLFPISTWQLFYFRGDAWSNPLSSAGASADNGTSPAPVLPDGVRLILTLPANASPSGAITLDWVRPNFSTQRS
jgi:general secretion pathway protein J